MDDLEKAARRVGALENGRFALRPFAHGPGWRASLDNAEILSTVGTLRPLAGAARPTPAEAVADLERAILGMAPGERVVVGARRPSRAEHGYSDGQWHEIPPAKAPVG